MTPYYKAVVESADAVPCVPCRYFVLHKLPGLTFLDSRVVSAVERKEAKRVGAFMRVVRPPDDTVSILCVCVCVCLSVCICSSSSCFIARIYPQATIHTVSFGF